MNGLLAWFAAARRDLPWRAEPRDPYRVWVSEVMLQQTRVETVLRYFEPFLARFSDVRALADAPEDALMKAWEGLGYYRRARLLQRGARFVAERGMPTSRDAWLAVPGVGPYTAGAIASLAFGEPAPAVDGNVLRVWSRVTGSDHDIMRPATRRAAETWVLAHQPRGAAGLFNEALMELGATVCAPRAPACDACPLARGCAARRMGLQDALPVKARKAKPRAMRISLAVARRGDALLLEKRESGLLAGTWGLPWVEGGPAALAAHVERLVGAPVRVARRPAAHGEHVFTHRRWEMDAYEVETSGGSGDWLAPSRVALGSAHRKILRLLVEP